MCISSPKCCALLTAVVLVDTDGEDETKQEGLYAEVFHKMK